MVYPLPIEVAKGLIPSIPPVEGGKMMVAAFVGTTMAAATFLSRPLFVKGKGWNISNLNQQKKDAIIAAGLVFVISASVMAVASGALFHQGQPVTKVLDPRTGRREIRIDPLLFWNFKCWAIFNIPMPTNRTHSLGRLPIR